MKFRPLIIAFAATLAYAAEPVAEEQAEEQNPAELEAGISPTAAAALAVAEAQLERLADMLAGVVDASTAATLAPHISAAYEALRNVDFSAFADEDEELVAAEFAEDMFLRLDAELARLADEDYFGNEELAELCGGPESEPAPVKPGADVPPVRPMADEPVPEAGTESYLQAAGASPGESSGGAAGSR